MKRIFSLAAIWSLSALLSGCPLTIDEDMGEETDAEGPADERDGGGGDDDPCADPQSDACRVCGPRDCGPQLGMPNYPCADGTMGGPTGRCLRQDGGECGWEIIECPVDIGRCAESADCPRGQYCDTPVDGACGDASVDGTCVPMPDACIEIYDPVCGCDGATYGNRCNAQTQRVDVQHVGACEDAGQCQPDECGPPPPMPMPGCEDGSEPIDVSIDCVRGDDGVCGWQLSYECHLPPDDCGGFAGLACAENQFCDFEPNQCGGADELGHCQPRPEGCPEIYAPVCGCDGETYGNECEAHQMGTDILHEGACPGVCVPEICDGLDNDCDGLVDELPECMVCGPDDCGPRPPEAPVGICEDTGEPMQVRIDCVPGPPGACVWQETLWCPPPADDCGGFAGLECAENQFCDFEPNQCGGADGLGRCQPRPEGCPQNRPPVCGCDGETYENECHAHQMGTDILHEGACPGVCVPEICDGLDNDCDGMIDELPECMVCEPEECGPPPPMPAPMCDDGTMPINVSVDCLRGDDGTCGWEMFFECPPPQGDCGGFAGLACAENQFCDFEPNQCGGADGLGRCQPRPQDCPQNRAPVCGCDGETYENVCHAHQTGTDILHEGSCEEDCVPEICDGLDNDCNGLVDELPGCPGPCPPEACGPPPELPMVDCPEGLPISITVDCLRGGGGVCEWHQIVECLPEPMPEICDGLDNDLDGEIDEDGICEGMCLPEACGPSPGAPAIQCPDGSVAGPECVEGPVGQCVWHIVECEDPPSSCMSFGEADCPDGDYCLYPAFDVCGQGGSVGVCQPQPDACAAILEPVCGCDLQNYDNPCRAHAAGVNVLHPGACDPACVPELEICDGLDNDCNGLVDEALECGPEPCDPAACGPVHPMPAPVCEDGVLVGAAVECVLGADAECIWQQTVECVPDSIP